jgi:hypothetical protein
MREMSCLSQSQAGKAANIHRSDFDYMCEQKILRPESIKECQEIIKELFPKLPKKTLKTRLNLCIKTFDIK